MKILSIVIALCIATVVGAQDCSQVLVKGKVVDTIQEQGFYNLMVINKTKSRGVFGQPSGSFSVYANEGDTIQFSITGYNSEKVIVKANPDCQYKIVVPIIKKVQIIEEVRVRPIKSLEEIKEERASLSMRETRTVTGVNVLSSPITALYERFSQKAQSKALVAKMEHQDNLNEVTKELLRLYVTYDIVELTEEEFEDFINFLNIEEQFLKTASDYELVVFIKDKFAHFKELGY